MPDEFTKLAEMLAAKDSVVSYLNNLENVKAAGTIPAEQYSSLKAEYSQRLSQIDSDITRSKSELQNLIATKQAEIDSNKFELSKIETKFKVGEISLETYRTSENSIKQAISGLEQYIDYVGRYVKAGSTEELRALFSQQAHAEEIPAKQVSNVQMQQKSKQPSKPNKKLPAVLAGVGGGIVVLVVAIVLVLLMGGGGQVQIPVKITGANNLGALHMELTYDPQSLSAISVKSGQAGKDAILEYNLDTPGKVVIGLVSVPGISQDGSLVTVVFKVQKGAGSTNLNIENISAYDADSLAAINSDESAGIFSADDKSFISPTLTFN